MRSSQLHRSQEYFWLSVAAVFGMTVLAALVMMCFLAFATMYTSIPPTHCNDYRLGPGFVAWSLLFGSVCSVGFGVAFMPNLRFPVIVIVFTVFLAWAWRYFIERKPNDDDYNIRRRRRRRKHVKTNQVFGTLS